MTAPTYGVDVPRVSADEATELMVYHLMMARSYFEAADEKTMDSELRRIMRSKNDQPEIVEAALAWVRAIGNFYDDLKEKQGP